MYGEKFFDEILESLLPGKWSRWIAGLTIPLAGLLWCLPQFLQGLGLQFPTIKKLLPHIIGPVTLLFLGTFTLLVITVFHIRELNKKIASLSTEITRCQWPLVLYQIWSSESVPTDNDGGSRSPGIGSSIRAESKRHPPPTGFGSNQFCLSSVPLSSCSLISDRVIE